MQKIRMHDLAQELEITCKRILDALPLLGVTEKRFHTSRLTGEEAEKVRQYFSSAPNQPRATPTDVAEIKTKIDLAHISKPGDVLRAINRAASGVPSAPRPLPPFPPAPPPTRPAPASVETDFPTTSSSSAPRVQRNFEPRRPTAPVSRKPKAYCERRHELFVTTGDEGLSYMYQCREANSSSEVASFPQVVTIPDIKRLADEVSHVLMRLSHQASNRPPDLSALQTVGGELFAKLIPAELAECLNEEKDFAHLVVGLPGELAWVPWELLWNGKEFLCQSFKVARLLPKLGKEFRAAQKRLHELRSGKGALILFGDTSDLKAQEERSEIERHLVPLFSQVWFQHPRTVTDVLRELKKDYEVCHFIGHGHYAEGHPSDSGWKLRDGSVLTCSQTEERISSKVVFPLLIFANSCDSANPALSRSQAYVHLLHHAFLRQGVPHYIGTIAKVPDHYDAGDRAQRYPAAEFASSFYRSLAAGLSVGDALGMTRREFFGRPGAPIWAYYVHYGDPAYRFLDRSRFHPRVTLPKTRDIFEQAYERSELFVGRFKELHAAREHLEALSRGTSSLLLFAGETGMGKTALMKRLLSDATRVIPGVVVTVGICQRQSDTPDAYLPFKTIFRSLTRRSEELGQPRPEANTVGELVASELFPCRQLYALVRPDLEVGPGQVERICAYLGMQPENLNVAPLQLDHSAVFDEALSVLRRISQAFPIVLAIEDLHWADDASLALFFRLARALQDRPILFVGTYRSHSVRQGRSEKDSPSLLQRALSDARRHGAHVVSLDFQRVTIADPVSANKKHSDLRRARSFVISYLRHALPIRYATERPSVLLVDKLTEYSGGNASLLIELVRSLCKEKRIATARRPHYYVWEFEDKAHIDIELPDPVQGLLEGRVGELSKDLQKILTIASVEGLEFSLEVVSKLLDMDDRALLGQLEDLIHTHEIIEESIDRNIGSRMLTMFTFRNRAIQSYFHQKLTAAQQQKLHRRAGECLEELYSQDLRGLEWSDAVPDLALHFRIAKEWEKALRYTLQAVSGRHSFWDRIADYENARKLLEKTSHVDKVASLLAIEAGLDNEGTRGKGEEGPNGAWWKDKRDDKAVLLRAINDALDKVKIAADCLEDLEDYYGKELACLTAEEDLEEE